MNYEIDRGIIKTKEGIPELPRWFCDDLVAFQVDRFGISGAEYFNQTTKGDVRVFIADMFGGIRFFLEDMGVNYPQNLKNTTILPFGFQAEWKYGNHTFRYEQRAVNNCLCISITPEKMEKDLKFVMEFYDGLCLITRKDGDFRFLNRGVERKWQEWKFEEGFLKGGYNEDGKETQICIGTNLGNHYQKREIGVEKKYIIKSYVLEEKKRYEIVIAFDTSSENAYKRAIQTLNCSGKYTQAQDSRYQKVIDRAPVLKSPYESLNNFFALAPLYHESCKVLSVPGAVRAKTEHYWVWGWDGMSSCFTYTYWGDADFIPEVLQMYQDTADSEKGFAHCFHRDMTHRETSMIAAQGFYINLLYQHFINDGNISPYYEFARKLFYMIKSTEVADLGLCEGYSLMPDFREVIDETGHDLSSFNNSSLYCAVCAMKILAQHMQDGEAESDAAGMIERMENNFERLLFDHEKGWFYTSADSKTLEPRKVYCANSIKWDNQFCAKLVKGKESKILEFFEKNFVCEPGLRPLPVWGKGYDADSNQAHCWWPSNGEIYSRLVNAENRKDLIDKWIGWISHWTDKLMCPEGIDCYMNISDVPADSFNSINGAWQAYSMRAWYEAAVHSVVGVDIDAEGLNFYPYDGEEMSLEGMHYGDKILDIYLKGSGRKIRQIVLNGKIVRENCKITKDMLEKRNTIEVVRC